MTNEELDEARVKEGRRIVQDRHPAHIPHVLRHHRRRYALSSPQGDDMSKWQPIETAPRDGTPILAAVFVHINGIPSHWDRHIIYADDETGVIHSDADQGWRWDDYTHWMPLPAVPKEPDHG